MNVTLAGEQSARRVRGALWTSVGLLVAFLLSLVFRSTGSYFEPVDGWGVTAFELSMGIICLARWFEPSWQASRSVAKAFPLVLGTACVSWATGDLVLTIQYGGGVAKVPSLPDTFYLGFFPLAYLGFMMLVRRGNAGSLVKTALDGLIVGLGAASLSAAYLFDSVRKAAGGSALSAATKMAYPVGDLLLFALAVGSIAVLPKQYRRFLVIAGAALAAVATGDLFNLLQPSSRIGYVANAIAWPVALLMFAIGMWTQPATVEQADNERPASFALPALGAVACIFILFDASTGHANRSAVGLATGTLLVAGVRLALNVIEGQSLRSARFRSLIDKAWDLIVVAESDLEIAFITPSAERVLGYSPAELQGIPITTHVHPDDADELVHRLGALKLSNTETTTFESRMRNRNGAWRIIAWTATNLLTDLSVRGYVLNGSDVTEVRRATEELAAARDGALMASKAKSEFVSTMSHEIRTPMNGVIGLTELLLTTALDPDQQELASGIRVSAESLLGIINDILDFSKIEAGKLELEEADIDVSGVVDDVGRILAVAAHKKGLELIVDAGSNVPATLVGDKMRLQQVLLNLGSNAVKFTAVGEVVIRLVVLREESARVDLRFEVIDQGIGIAPEDQKRLFRAFAQADSSTTRRFGGTGLGLAIARQLVDLMGGRLGLMSAPGEGSTFWFEVSLKRGETSSARRHEEDAASIAGRRAVIIDDNATNRRILRQQLASWGVESVEAVDAYDAIQVIGAAARAGEPFDLGIVDLNMPGVDGMELAQILKSEPATADTTLFLLSSSGQRLGAADSQLRGFAACMTKPVRSSELFDSLITNLRSERQRPADPEQSGIESIDTPEVARVILLVEDNKMNQLVGSKVLTKLGYSLDIANNGLEALNAICRNTYDAVLMDCQMPEMDGYEATTAIRKMEGNRRRLPIIAMTAGAMEGDREACIAAGMDDYITKPVRLEAIAEVLERWVKGRGGGDGNAIEGAASTSEPAPNPIDHSQFDVLRSLDDGDGAVLTEIIQQFLAETDHAGSQLADSVSRGDFKTLERTAHTVKGASANLGATGLAMVCDQIETCGRQAELDLAAGLVKRFDLEVERVRQALNLLTAEARA